MLLFINSFNKYKIEIGIINTIILLFILRPSCPFFKYPFLLIYIVFLLYSIYEKKDQIIKIFFRFIYIHFISLILLLIIIIAFIFSNKIYLVVFKDIINIVVILSLFYFLFLYVDKKDKLYYFTTNFIFTLICCAFIISLIGLIELFELLPNSIFFTQKDIFINQLRDVGEFDYNFAVLPVIFGLLGILFLLKNEINKKKIVLFNLLFVFLSFHIFLSGSRRGIIILLILLVGLVFYRIYFSIKKHDKVFFKYNLIIYLTFFFVFVIYLFVFHTSCDFKNKTLKFIGTKNFVTTKNRIAISINRYTSVFNKDKTFYDTYNIIWSPVFDPLDPDSGWGSRIHKTVFPLTGINVEIVPKEAKGYLMDSTCNADTWNGHAFSYSHIGFLKCKNVSDSIQASVYCFVSNDFNGSWACITCYSNSIVHYGSTYDLTKKGTWQKLTVKVGFSNDEVGALLYFSKYKITDFTTLKGYLIFAYPQMELLSINNKRNTLSNSNKLFDKKSETEIKDRTKSNIELNDRNNIFKLSASTKQLSTNFSFLELGYISSQYIQDRDPIRNWVAKFISEDTTYYRCKSAFYVDTISNGFSDLRLVRWKFAFKIYSNEYSWFQKVFGGGFNFLNWYGYYFLNDKTKNDYPHNPFLHILLYSGIIGLLIYMFFLYMVFYNYIHYIKEYYILFIFFLITFFFTFFSGGNPFDPPIMGFFIILPFFIHYVHQNDNEREIKE